MELVRVMRWGSVAAAVALVAALVGPAGAQVEDTCPPDGSDPQPPLLYDFAVGPSLVPFGTEFRVTVDDRYTCLSTIAEARMTVDGTLTVNMDPADGDFGLPDQREVVVAVLPPDALEWGRTHTVHLEGVDGAGNVGVYCSRDRPTDPCRDPRIYHFTPLVTGDCRAVPEVVCP